MKVGLISDVHANLAALNAVIKHARSQGVQAIWNMGDSVGYGADPDEVVRALRQERVVSIRGNFDRRVLKFPGKRSRWRRKKRPEVFLALHWASENLSAPSRTYLKNLPKQIRLRMGRFKFLITHASPASDKEHVTKQTPAKVLRNHLSNAGVDMILGGHSHQPFVRHLKNGIWINPGSVGRQSDGDPRTSYAVLELSPAMLDMDYQDSFRPVVRHYRLEYNLDEAVNAVRKRHLPEAFAQMFIRGQDLETVLGNPESWQVPDLQDQDWWSSPFKDQTREEFEDQKISQVIKLAGESLADPEHVKQTTFLALRLFDELQPLHRLTQNERFWLRCGALLHDLKKGKKNHHLRAVDAILKSRKLRFSPREKNIIASIARYHRQEGPREDHEHLTALPAVDQRVVTILSSILRVADGLDSSPRGNVSDLTAVYSPEEITIKCQVQEQAEKHKKKALGKGELMEFAFDRALYIEWHRI